MRKTNKKTGFTAVLLAAFMLTGTGCAQNNGYYSPTAPQGYYYSDPGFCATEKGVCPLLIAAGIGGLVAVLAHH